MADQGEETNEEFATRTVVFLEVDMFPTLPRGENDEISRGLLSALAEGVNDALDNYLGERNLETNVEVKIQLRDVISSFSKEVDL